jgi:hypothetical protein
MANAADRYITIALLEPGADAFDQTSGETGIVPTDGEAWELLSVELQFDVTQLAGLAADASIDFSLCRDTKLAVANLQDGDCIYADGLAFSLTTSGAVMVPSTIRHTFPAGTFFVEPEIYAQIDSTGTGAALGASMRIHYQIVKLSVVDILTLLANT